MIQIKVYETLNAFLFRIQKQGAHFMDILFLYESTFDLNEADTFIKQNFIISD